MDIRDFYKQKDIEETNEYVDKDKSPQNKKRKMPVIKDNNKKKKSKEEKIMGEVEKTVDLYKRFLERNVYLFTKKQTIRYSRKQLDEEIIFINET